MTTPMTILVAIKHTVDPYVKVSVKPDGSGVNTAGVKMGINPFCEIALEEALRLREKGVAVAVEAVTIGPAQAAESLRKCLAMGADKATHIRCDDIDGLSCLTALDVARALFGYMQTKKEEYPLVLLGKQAIDGDGNQVGQMLAGLLNRAQGTFASKVDIAGKTATVTRETDDGLETIELPLPCVLTTDLRLNTPRLVTLPNVMKAKQKPLETVSFESLGLTLAGNLKILSVSEPPPRKKGKMVASVEELVQALKTTRARREA